MVYACISCSRFGAFALYWNRRTHTQTSQFTISSRSGSSSIVFITSTHNHQPGSSRPRPCTHRILNINFLVRNGTCAILLHIHGQCSSSLDENANGKRHINLLLVSRDKYYGTSYLWGTSSCTHRFGAMSMCAKWFSMNFLAFRVCVCVAAYVVHATRHMNGIA